MNTKCLPATATPWLLSSVRYILRISGGKLERRFSSHPSCRRRRQGTDGQTSKWLVAILVARDTDK